MHVFTFYTNFGAFLMEFIAHIVYFCATLRPSCGGLKGWHPLRFSERSENYDMPRLFLYSFALMPLNLRRG